MKKKIVISTGGTGGHVIPALELYNHLKNTFDVMIYTDLRGSKYIPIEIKKTIFEVKKVPEKSSTLNDVSDLPAKFLGKDKAIAGCVKEITIEVRI